MNEMDARHQDMKTSRRRVLKPEDGKSTAKGDYKQGYRDGYVDGFEAGRKVGHQKGRIDGFADGHIQARKGKEACRPPRKPKATG